MRLYHYVFFRNSRTVGTIMLCFDVEFSGLLPVVVLWSELSDPEASTCPSLYDSEFCEYFYMEIKNLSYLYCFLEYFLLAYSSNLLLSL